MNLLVVSLGEKNAKDYCEIEMLNEKTENARVAAGAAINALKGKFIGQLQNWKWITIIK